MRITVELDLLDNVAPDADLILHPSVVAGEWLVSERQPDGSRGRIVGIARTVDDGEGRG